MTAASEASKRGKRNRSHGHESERMVARYLREHDYPDAETTRKRLGADGAKQPGDISFTPGVSLEVKSRKGSSWPSWMAQAVAEAGPYRIAAVVRRTRGVTDVGLWETRWSMPVEWFNGDVITFWVHGTFAQFIDTLKEEA